MAPSLRLLARVLTSLLVITALQAAPAAAQERTYLLEAGGGPTLTDPGYSVAGAFGVALTPRIGVLARVERTHLAASDIRGGTLTLGSAELQIAGRVGGRVTPYSLIGCGAGISQPNVNGFYADPITSGIVAPFVGGGVRAGVSPRLSVFADVRWMLAVGVDSEELIGVVPLLAGIAWRW